MRDKLLQGKFLNKCSLNTDDHIHFGQQSEAKYRFDKFNKNKKPNNQYSDSKTRPITKNYNYNNFRLSCSKCLK